MIFTGKYTSPLGDITIACDDVAIIGLWFDDQKYFGSTLPHDREVIIAQETPLLAQARRWLDIYFTGHEPDFLPPLRYNSTPFRELVAELMLAIPYGRTLTYGDLAAAAARHLGRPHMSAQAIGGAVGHNPIALMIPCHRVLGAGGALTGYAAGLERKRYLLELERGASSISLAPSPRAIL